MSFWSWWSRNPVIAEPTAVVPERRPTFTDADRQYVRAALDRFEACGLQIWSKLDREFIVARALVDAERWGYRRGDEPPENGLPLDHDPIRDLFLALTCETEATVFYVDELEEQFPALSAMDEEAVDAVLAEHGQSIFVNAESINTVNEGNDTFLRGIVETFDALATGTLDVKSISQDVTNSGLTGVSFQVDGLGERHIQIESHKRPDITPALVEINRIAKSKGLGQFIRVAEGNSESDTFIFTTDTHLLALKQLLHITD